MTVVALAVALAMVLAIRVAVAVSAAALVALTLTCAMPCRATSERGRSRFLPRARALARLPVRSCSAPDPCSTSSSSATLTDGAIERRCGGEGRHRADSRHPTHNTSPPFIILHAISHLGWPLTT